MNAPATLVLVGPPGAGKSTLARRLARALATSHTDTDELIEARCGRPCGEVFSEMGEEAFRDLEEEIVVEALGGRGVVSLGGGAVTRQRVRDLLAGHTVVWVDVTAEEAVARTLGDSTRPVLQAGPGGDPVVHYQDLLAAREAFYRGVSDVHVRTEKRRPAQVATEILAAVDNLDSERAGAAFSTSAESSRPRCVEVSSPHPYTVLIGNHLAGRIAERALELGAGKVGVVYQPPLRAAAENLRAELSECGLETHLLPIADAEAAKTLTECGRLWDRLGEAQFSRGDALVGLGGGAATDLAGFVAATWMRGIAVLQVPTTVLAMVDAAVGGKTGINTAAGKNLVGAFHEPAGVFVDLEFLRALPERELRAGSAEIIKTGFIADERILELFEADPRRALDVDGDLPELIERAVAVKARVVGQDLKEAGLREILNYGHTFGHAVEHHEEFRWRHGDAVAVGMMYVAELSRARGLINAGLVERHRRILSSVGLPTSYGAGPWRELREAMGRDKKNRGGQLRFVALDGEVGRVTRIVGPAEGELMASWRAIGGAE